jgi:hypothetical protein
MPPNRNPTDCLTAQTVPDILGNGPINPDVGGFAVGLSSVLDTFQLFLSCLLIDPCQISSSIYVSVSHRIIVAIYADRPWMDTPAMLFMWSATPDDPDIFRASVYGLYSQVYPILMATIASIHRRNLSLYEAHFAIAVSASPITVYLAYRACYDVFRQPSLFRPALKDTRNPVARWLALILPFFWLIVNAIVSFSPTAFKNSDLCKGMTVQRWLEFQIVSNFVGVLDVMGRRDLWSDLRGRGGLGAISVGALWAWGVYFIRHLPDIWKLFVIDEDNNGRKFYVRWASNVHKAVRASW